MNRVTMTMGALALGMMVCLPAFAARAWTASLVNWRLTMDNGVAYVNSSTLSTCANQRAQIDTSATIYTPTNQRDLFAFVLAQSLAGNTLSIVTDDAESPCKVYGAQN